MRAFRLKTSLAKTLRRNQTDVERRLWSHLRDRRLEGLKFRRQVPIGPYVVDFACVEALLVIELDGSQHVEEQAAYDGRRTTYLKGLGYQVLRFWNSDILTNIEGVAIEIVRMARQGPHPVPLPEGEGALIPSAGLEFGS
ncbi:endonuclease domain-containing protein [Kaistia algarum]|uniref:endonuclease domain-containing protein n=1 Tax=Kaistia algarum TaxID=2083279 RepID=UPI000CE8892E|nr:endonuclease domain-containing protein [Kaistia algarum]MCX5515909.1 endonuclease domain-containing protein [Kaistia algarum]PPE80727.1 endonuclease domain-containing protein [Kaistia algarum]